MGGEAYLGSAPKYYFVNCADCMASTNMLIEGFAPETADEAIAAWNTRAPDAALTARAEAAEAELAALKASLPDARRKERERCAAKLHWLWDADGTKTERRVAVESAAAIRAMEDGE